MTWSPVFRWGVYVGLCFPLRSLATLLASPPSAIPVASTTYQSPSRSACLAVQVLNLAISLVHQLNDHHRGCVAQPRALPSDAGVAARPLLQARHEVGEEFVGDLRLGDVAGDPAAGGR